MPDNRPLAHQDEVENGLKGGWRFVPTLKISFASIKKFFKKWRLK